MSVKLLNSFGIVVFCIVSLQWLMTIRVYGYLAFELFLPMLQLAFKTRQIYLIVAGVGGVVGGICGILLPGYFLPLVVLQLSLGLSAILSACLPPSILLLGLARDQNANLYGEIAWIYPLRAIHMLGHPLGFLLNQSARDEHSQRTARKRDSGFDTFTWKVINPLGYRVFLDTPSAWLPTVQQFMRIAPMIVVDTRIVDRWILLETEIILSSFDILSKTVFIVGSHGESPVLDRFRSSFSSSLVRTIICDDLSMFLKKVRHDFMFDRQNPSSF